MQPNLSTAKPPAAEKPHHTTPSLPPGVASNYRSTASVLTLASMSLEFRCTDGMAAAIAVSERHGNRTRKGSAVFEIVLSRTRQQHLFWADRKPKVRIGKVKTKLNDDSRSPTLGRQRGANLIDLGVGGLVSAVWRPSWR